MEIYRGHLLCFRWPGDPIGSCPSKGLFACQTQQRVIGCTHHQSFYNALLDRRLYSISIIRHPYRRSVSAFFYPGIHHNEDCTKAQRGQHECFLEYTADPRYVSLYLYKEYPQYTHTRMFSLLIFVWNCAFPCRFHDAEQLSYYGLVFDIYKGGKISR